MGTMVMGASTQIFDTSRAGVLAIAAMIMVGFFLFCLQRRSVQKSKNEWEPFEILPEYKMENAE